MKKTIIGFLFISLVVVACSPLITKAFAVGGNYSDAWQGYYNKEVTRVTPFIRVVTPKNGTFDASAPLNITWQGTNLAGRTVDVTIQNTVTNTIYTLATGTPNTGSATVAIPTVVPGGKYDLKITTSTSTLPSVSGVSDNSIKINAAPSTTASIKIINQPQTTVSVGGVASTSWTNTGNTSKVKITLVSPNSSTVLEKRLNNNWSYSYKIDKKQASGIYDLLIEDADNANAFATTTSFTISNSLVPVSSIGQFAVTPASIASGGQVNATWTGTNANPLVIKIYQAGTNTAVNSLVLNPSVNSRLITADISAGNYVLSLQDSKNAQVLATTSLTVTAPIVQPAITLASPASMQIVSSQTLSVSGLNTLQNVPAGSQTIIVLDNNYRLASSTYTSVASQNITFTVGTTLGGLGTITPVTVTTGTHTINVIVMAPDTSGTVGGHGPIIASSTVANVNILAAAVAAPAIPSSVVATASSTCGGKTTITWAPVTGATSYSIFGSTGANSTYASVASGITNTTYNDTPGQGTFYYKVSAVSSSGESARSVAVHTTSSPICVVASTITVGALQSSYNLGDSLPISWQVTPANSISRVDVLLVNSGGIATTTIANNISNTGLNWNIPTRQTVGGGYKILVRSSSGAAVSALSNSFTIGSAHSVSFVAVSTTTLNKNDDLKVIWTTNNITNVGIQVYSNTTGAKVGSVITKSASLNQATFKANFNPGNYVIRVYDTSNISVWKEASFSVVASSQSASAYDAIKILLEQISTSLGSLK